MTDRHTPRPTVRQHRYRVLVAQLFHETHGFNPHPTTEERLTVQRGDRLLEQARGTGTTLGGIVSKLAELGYEAVPAIGFVAQPSGPIEHAFYLRMRDELVNFAREQQCDAIALDLHGAMCTTALTDAEGDLLLSLRIAVGPRVPIGIGLDMHAHVTSMMLRAVDVCVACKESPHTDFPECGERVVEGLAAVLEGKLRPVRAMAKAPMIHLDSGLTACGALARIKARATALAAAHPKIFDISLYQVFRFSDYEEEKGQTAVVLTDNDADLAARIAEQLAQEFWDNRESFREKLLTIDAALDLVLHEPDRRPFVLADSGDRVLAGAPGDSTEILAHALRRPDNLRGAVPVTDPVSAAAAAAAGVGARISLAIGGRLTPGFAPLPVTGVVTHVGDGRFDVSGPVLSGVPASLGQSAVLLVDGRCSVLLTTESGLTHTPAAFTSQGIDLRQHDFIVAKSGMHFQANFAGVATPLMVETPGLTLPIKGFFRWRHSRFWPEHDMGEPLIRARIYAGREEPEVPVSTSHRNSP